MLCFVAVVGAPFMTGLRVLVVEDEGLIAMVLDDYLRDLGCTVVGPLPNIAMARDALDTEEFDVALLDINLGGYSVFPVADELMARGIAFGFMTAHNVDTLPARYQDMISVSKPYTAVDVERAVKQLALRQPQRREG